jgi:hypothetical protein
VSEITELIDAQVAAYRERDLGTFLSFYSDDIEIRDMDGNVLMDRSVMSEQYGQLFSSSPNLAVEIANRIEVGDKVIDEERITGFVLPGYPTELHAAVVYAVEDGRISRVILLS